MAQDQFADLCLLDGRIVTLEEGSYRPTALAVRQGLIQLVGRDEEVLSLVGHQTRVHHLNGKIVLPGFIDAHTHFVSFGVGLTQVDLSAASSRAEVLEKIRRRAKVTALGEWIVGRQWDESRWREGNRYLIRQDIDPVVPDHPVLLIRIDGHMGTVNSSALETLKIPAGTWGVDRDLKGELTGVLKEQALEWALAAVRPGRARLKAAIQAATERAHQLGVTSIHDVVNLEYTRAYADLLEEGALKIRVNLMLKVQDLDAFARGELAIPPRSGWLKLGAIKIYADGSLGARTAALTLPYADDRDNHGLLLYTREELGALVARVHEQYLQLAIHAIGDRAIAFVLEVLGELLVERPRPIHRHRLEHVELATGNHLRQIKELGVVASMQPNFLGNWAARGQLYEWRLGEPRFSRNNVMEEIAQIGIPLAFGSDMMPFSPLFGLHSAVNAPFPHQRLPVKEAIRAYTVGGAFAEKEEERKGTLRRGKVADLIVLSEDPFRNPEAIQEITVLMTVQGGEVVYLGPELEAEWRP